MSRIFALTEVKKVDDSKDPHDFFETNSTIYTSKEEAWKEAWKIICERLVLNNILPRIAHSLFEPVFKTIFLNCEAITIDGDAIQFFAYGSESYSTRDYFEKHGGMFYYIAIEEVKPRVQLLSKHRIAPNLESILKDFADDIRPHYCPECAEKMTYRASCVHYEEFNAMKPTELQKRIIQFAFAEKKRWEELNNANDSLSHLDQLSGIINRDINAAKGASDMNDTEKKLKVDSLTKRYQDIVSQFERLDRYVKKVDSDTDLILESEFEKADLDVKKWLEWRGRSYTYFQSDTREEVCSSILLIEKLVEDGLDISKLDMEKIALRKQRDDRIREKMAQENQVLISLENQEERHKKLRAKALNNLV